MVSGLEDGTHIEHLWVACPIMSISLASDISIILQA